MAGQIDDGSLGLSDGDRLRASPRVAVIDTSGSGKTSFARELAAVLNRLHIELDMLHWGPNWTPRPDFAALVEAAVAGDTWVDEEPRMRKVRFSAAVSLDGYIAGPNGESDWIVMDPDIDFGALMSEFDTILLGRKTYEATRRDGGGGMPGMHAFVFSHTLRQEDCPGVTVSRNPQDTIADIRTVRGKDIWLFGGGELLCSLLDLGLVDSVELAVIPVLLGNGLPLAPQLAKQTRLTLTNHQVYPKTGTVSLEYALP